MVGFRRMSSLPIPSLSSFIRHFSVPRGPLVIETKKEIRNDMKLFPLTLRHRWRLHSYHIVYLSAVPEAINYHNDGPPIIIFFLSSFLMAFCSVALKHWYLAAVAHSGIICP